MLSQNLSIILDSDSLSESSGGGKEGGGGHLLVPLYLVPYSSAKNVHKHKSGNVEYIKRVIKIGILKKSSLMVLLLFSADAPDNFLERELGIKTEVSGGLHFPLISIHDCQIRKMSAFTELCEIIN